MELAVLIGFALLVNKSLALFVHMLKATLKLKNYLPLFVHSVTSPLPILSQTLKDEVQDGVKLKKA